MEVAAVEISIDDLLDIGTEKPIFLLKTLLVNLLECYKTIFDTTVVSDVAKTAPSSKR